MSRNEVSDDELTVGKKGCGSDVTVEATFDVRLQDESSPAGLNAKTELVPKTEEVKSVDEHDLATPADNNMQAVTNIVHVMTDVGITHSACTEVSSDTPQKSISSNESGQHAAEDKADAITIEHCADGEELNRDVGIAKTTLNAGRSGKDLISYQNKAQNSDWNEHCSASGVVSKVISDERFVRNSRDSEDLDQTQPTSTLSGSGGGSQEGDEMKNDNREEIINAENILAEWRSTAAGIPDAEEVHSIDSSVSQDTDVRNTHNTEVTTKPHTEDVETEQSLAHDVICEVNDSNKEIREEGMGDQPTHATTENSEHPLEQSQVATGDNSKVAEGLIGDDDARNGVDGNEMDSAIARDVKEVDCDTKTASSCDAIQEACPTEEGNNDGNHSEEIIKGATTAQEQKDLTEPKQIEIVTEPCYEQSLLVQGAAISVTDSNDVHNNPDINSANISGNSCPSNYDLNHKSGVEECAKAVSVLQDIPSNNDNDVCSEISSQSPDAAGSSVSAHVHSDTDVSGNQVAEDHEKQMECLVSTGTSASPSRADNGDQGPPSNTGCRSADVENPSIEIVNKGNSSIAHDLDIRGTQTSGTVEQHMVDAERVECPTGDVTCEDLKAVNIDDVYEEMSGSPQTLVIDDDSEQNSVRGEEETEDNNKRTERLVDHESTVNEVDFSDKSAIGDIVAIDVKEVVICDAETGAADSAVLESWPTVSVKSEVNVSEETTRHDANDDDHEGLTELKHAVIVSDPSLEQPPQIQPTVVTLFHSSNKQDEKNNVFNQQPVMNEHGSVVADAGTKWYPEPAKADGFVMVSVCNSSPGIVSVGDTFDNSHTKNGQQTKRRTLHWSLESNESHLRTVNPLEHTSSKRQIGSRCQRQKSTNIKNGLKLQGVRPLAQKRKVGGNKTSSGATNNNGVQNVLGDTTQQTVCGPPPVKRSSKIKHKPSDGQNNVNRGRKRCGESRDLLDSMDLSQTKRRRSRSRKSEKISPVPLQGPVVLSPECRKKYSHILNKPAVVVLEVIGDKTRLAGLNKNSAPKMTTEQQKRPSCQYSGQSHRSQPLASSPCVTLEQLPRSAFLTCTKSSVHPPKKTESAQSGDDFVKRRCPQCNDLFPREMLKNHFRTKHRKVRFPFQCPKCKRKFLFQDNLHEHCLSCIGVKKTDKGPVKRSIQETMSLKKPTCPACEKRFVNTKRLKDHYQIKHKCDVSQPFTSSKKTAASHTEVQKTNAAQRRHQAKSGTWDHTSARYKATETSQSEEKWQQINERPQATVSANVVYKCSFCPKAFTDRILLTSHMDCYHECDRTERLIQLSDHAEEEHGGDVVFLCMHCDKYFCDLSTFREHQITAHESSIQQTSPDLPVDATPAFESSVSRRNQNQCVLCDFKTRTLVAMRRHTRHVHGSMYSCRLCSDVFTLPHSVTRHSLIVHGTDKNVVLPVVRQAQDAGMWLPSGHHRMKRSGCAGSRKARGSKQGQFGNSAHAQSMINRCRSRKKRQSSASN